MKPAIHIIPMGADYFERDAKGRECYAAVDYYVYAGDKLVRVCPSLAMAREVASGL